MARVTARFKDNYECWSAHKVKTGQFTQDEMTELKGMIRKDLVEGPDQIRQGLTIITAAGVEVPAMIDDHEERYRLWDRFFAEECAAIRAEQSSGINTRIRQSIATRRLAA